MIRLLQHAIRECEIEIETYSSIKRALQQKRVEAAKADLRIYKKFLALFQRY